jgi:hypothetical protein
MLDHFGSGINCDQNCKWGIEWDTCAPEPLGRKKVTAQAPDWMLCLLGARIAAISSVSPAKNGQTAASNSNLRWLCVPDLSLPFDKFLSLGGRSEEISQICIVWGKAVAVPRYFYPRFVYANLRFSAIEFARW